ncbi:hypothetical protein [Alkalibacillus silvisoli]|uniref:hypothetical protein n=1 Tax=Alkalibacillus silvisoli TaxID=392823 RepID=UPI003CD0BAAF
MQNYSNKCSECDSNIEDQGKVIDYFDDYSAYMDISLMKLLDGDPQSFDNHQCLHYFYCENCNHEEIIAVNEEGSIQ